MRVRPLESPDIVPEDDNSESSAEIVDEDTQNVSSNTGTPQVEQIFVDWEGI